MEEGGVVEVFGLCVCVWFDFLDVFVSVLFDEGL